MHAAQMKRTVLILVFLKLCTSFSFAQSSKGYRLVWADEFNYTGAPDPSKWNCQTGFLRNYEPQWYQAENARVSGGFLTITAKKEKRVNPNFDRQSKNWKINRSSAPYTSASLSTKGKFDFRYGKVQMRAKIDIAKGMWPAFWMLGTKQVTWPANGEVDIMEYFHGNLHANAVWAGKNGEAWSIKKVPTSSLGGEAWAKEFHTWEMIWDESKIIISVDNQKLSTIDLSQTINHKTKENPFHNRFYLLVNLAMGQKWEKVPDSSLPSKFILDYIRVYQKRKQGS
jgi:beta-glucanase (GH16 family)